MGRDRATAIFQTLAVLVLMSLGTVLMKLSLKNVSPYTFTALSILIGAIVMSVYTFVIRRERVPGGLGRSVWALIIGIGIGNFVISRFANSLVLSVLPATTVAFVGNFVGFVTMALSVFILREKPTIYQLLGAVVAIVGLRVFFVEIPPTDQILAIGLKFVGMFATAYTNNTARKLALLKNNQLSNNTISTLALLIGGSIAMVAGFAASWPPKVEGWQNWAIILYSGVVSIAIGLTVWNNILRTLRSYEASLLGSSSVIWTALLAIPILGEHLDPNQVLGVLITLAGLAIVQLRGVQLGKLKRRSQPDAQPRQP